MKLEEYNDIIAESKEKESALVQRLYFWNLIRQKIKSKTEKLLYHEVEITLYHNTESDYYELYIKSLKDPNIKGYVLYETSEDGLLAFNNLKGKGYIIDYMFNNCKDSGDALQWSKIIVDELKVLNTEKQKYNPNDINVATSARSYVSKSLLPKIVAPAPEASVDKKS